MAMSAFNYRVFVRCINPHISPSDAKIAPDFLMRPFPGAPPVGILWMSKSAPGGFVRLRVPANESIVVLWLSEHVPAGAKKTSEGASSVVCYIGRAEVLS